MIPEQAWPTEVEQTRSTLLAVVEAIDEGDQLDPRVHSATEVLAQHRASLLGDDPLLRFELDSELAAQSGRLGRPPESVLASWSYCKLFDAITDIRQLLLNSLPVAPAAAPALANAIESLMDLSGLRHLPRQRQAVAIEMPTNKGDADSETIDEPVDDEPIKEAATG
ncbi:MAG TPA: hypothetical protein VFZ58_00975 [Candidatus Saccharimonadales bacterium]